MLQDVLQDDDASLDCGKFDKPRYGRLDRFLVHQHLQGIGSLGVRRLRCRFKGFGRADGAAAQKVEGPVMSDAEQPGAQGRRCLQGIQSHKGLGEGVLDDVLAVDDRTGQASTIAVQFRPQVANQSEEFRLVDAAGWPFQAQAASSSSMVIPVSPLSPNCECRCAPVD
jgi:hypothetical protein